MTDRELLKLAAKAAGMDYSVWSPGSAPIVWNPLHYDGDALRLAMQLDLVVLQRNAKTRNGYQAVEAEGADLYAATRRAIVRAAAEIGRTLP